MLVFDVLTAAVLHRRSGSAEWRHDVRRRTKDQRDTDRPLLGPYLIPAEATGGAMRTPVTVERNDVR